MHNNEVGINIGLALTQNKVYNKHWFWTRWSIIIDAVRNAINNGLLLKFDSTGTQLIPTNK